MFPQTKWPENVAEIYKEIAEEDRRLAQSMWGEVTRTMATLDADHIAAHGHSIHHREEILSSVKCGCFYCLKILPPSAIREWANGDTTAICPFCPVDAVIGDASGYPITPDFLRKMRAYWF